MNDPMSAKAASAGVAAAAGGGAWWAAATQVAADLFGVPLSAVLLGALGAFGARTFLVSAGLVATLRAGALWTAIGCGMAPLAGYLLNVPDKFLGGLCLAGASLGQLAWPVVVEQGPRWIERLVSRITGGGGDGHA